MFAIFFPALHQGWQILQVPICFVSAWGLMISGGWRLATTVQAGIALSKRLHQIPCADCQFFTGSYYLKCPVHPDTALSERAIDCRDFKVHPASNLASNL